MPAAGPYRFDDLDAHLGELEERGYTLFSDYLQPEITAAVRAQTDTLVESGLPVVTSPWVDTDKPRMLVNRRLGTNEFRHPLPGHLPGRLAADRDSIELSQHLIGSTNLRLREQIFIRTETEAGGKGATGWHIDSPFLREEYEAQPRQIYYQMIHYCSTVRPGGGGLMIVPGSHRKVCEVSTAPGSESERDALAADPIAVAGIDVEGAVEICAGEGAVVVFNPMCLHSASFNNRADPRYVYFTSFYDPSAVWLVEFLRKTRYRNCFPDSLYASLPTDLHYLLG